MRRQVATVVGVTVSPPIIMDTYISPFNVGFGVVATGTVTYSVQHTFDDVFAADYVPASGNWFNHPTIVAVSTTQDGNYAFPVSAIRFNVTAGTGSIAAVVIQAGQVGG
jgi:hypothetical protein